MALPSVSSLWTFARKIDRVLEAEAKQVRVNDALQQQIAELADRLSRVEAREEVVVAKAEGASRAAAMSSATSAVAEIARRLGVLEERSRVDDSKAKRLPRS